MRKTALVKAFTLIELLVVISIIALISTLLLANLNAARERGRDAQRKADLRNIQTALRLYYNDNSIYPLVGDLPVWGSPWTDGSVTYMNILPADPLSPTQDYVYARDAVDTDLYTLYACLENPSDDKGIVEAGCASGYKYEVKP